MSIAELIGRIDAAPQGDGVAAFFDFDGTLIDGYSAMAMMQARSRGREIDATEAARLLVVGVRAWAGKADFDTFMRSGVRAFEGRSLEELDRLGERLARSSLGGTLFPEACALITAHRRRGHRVVIASSALPFQVQPLARELGADRVLCTRLVESDDGCTGEVAGDVLWGEPKAAAVHELAGEQELDLGACFAYANGDEDVPFLESVGNPCAVNPQDALWDVAEARDWPVAWFEPRGSAGPVDAARTVAAYAGMAASFGVGVGLGLLNRSRRDATNLTMSLGTDVALSLAGVQLNVSGEHHLWSQRPCVFIFNHQSWLDGLVIMKLLRQDVTGVAKKEVASQPGFGQFARLANMAFVDRSDGAKAKDALKPVVERVQEGYSIVLAPEGTRSTTPRVGTFKKGAFHIAMQAGVPIVPIVLRNAGELLWRGSTFIRSGAVDVRVLEPVAVDGWDVEDLDERVAEVHRRFVDTLAEWEGPRVAGAPPT